METPRDVGVVLSGGGVNGVLMELGFLQRLRASALWSRVAAIFGTSSGALSGTMAALDRLDELEAFLLELRPEQAFRPHRLWRLPFLGLYDYALPRTVEERLGDPVELATRLADAPIEMVVLATDVTDDGRDETGYELVYSSRRTPPETMAEAVLASAAVSALVLPVRVADRIATDGSWVRNFPLAHAYGHPAVELIVSFRYLPQYPRLGVAALHPLRRRLQRFARIPPVRALLAELDDAEARAERGEPAHLADTIVRLARVAILRNTLLEERAANEKDQSLRELRALRRDVLQVVGDGPAGERVAARFDAATFPFRHDRLVPRVSVVGSTGGISLEPGLRSQPDWTVEAKQTLIRRGWQLADDRLAAIGDDVDARLGSAGDGT
ncbi:MAG TPA: patatin-like phospholipase family protein [Gaiellaceae bacterium]|jgi:predicted acylesterase/phospholipase RssA